MGDMVTPLDRRVPHPLEQLSIGECNTARDVILSTHGVSVIDFRTINLEEPPKSLLQPFLDLEAEGRIPKPDAYPPRLARVAYDVISENKVFEFYESVVELVTGAVKVKELIDASHQAPLVIREFDHLVEAVWASKTFQDAMAEFSIPDGFEVIVEPWPYGGRDPDDEDKRYFQGLCFAQDKRSGNPDSNFYAYPLPLIPVMDARTKEIVRIDRLGTGGKQDGLAKGTHNKEIIKHCKGAEYVPELLENGSRKDLKPLDVIQPDGPSFTVTDESLVEWQKWRFRVGFNPREGATIHDVRYEGRSIVYRMAISEMTVPYADARAPFHRKQAFDFGDGGAGTCANNLQLGCDCLGHIKYFDSVNVAADGTATEQPNIVCLHEQDNGIGWKHTNWRTGRAVVTRHRELVVQFIITLANYEYIFAYKFDQAGGIVVETRATGIVSVVNIDEGKTSMYGNVVSPGAMAQNHQHIFAVRVDPAIDGPNNTIVLEESHPVPTSSDRNPAGNLYEVRQTPIKESGGHDAAPEHNRIVRIMNPNKTNPISGKPVSYKFKPPPTQKLLAQPGSIQARRATFTQHHVWVTKYKDNELYAGGRYTLQSRDEVDGVADAAKRAENVENTDVVLWSVFGLTHNPRVEDWPVMPVEIYQLHFSPGDFFTANPAIDVPSQRNLSSTLHQKKKGNCCAK
ncbi:Amine oxidase catalytic [Glarea lozoyensis ATCC 20868]|uniref:Amine oxidase n=1 Tax=Glarea lozoyensis (strain ATCC 20868 / MF5171) TaxID=1116229 RepID=S3CKY3_GLAL2|nr:Amine oxidase catalytic [Glarea lozoyensis ATCC 20868]EPE25859.1 Amine oxidase catalytic [Glarea lozoyensis ATCC 20868]